MSCVTARFIEGVGLDLGEVMCLHLIVPLIEEGIADSETLNSMLKTFDKCRVHAIKDAGITKLVVISGNEYGNIYTLESIDITDINEAISKRERKIGDMIIIEKNSEHAGILESGKSDNVVIKLPIQLWTEFQIMEKVKEYKMEPEV